ncbi:MAG: hypothetical protein D6732_16165, partial [Methanobacteriota archaeon]
SFNLLLGFSVNETVMFSPFSASLISISENARARIRDCTEHFPEVEMQNFALSESHQKFGNFSL